MDEEEENNNLSSKQQYYAITNQHDGTHSSSIGSRSRPMTTRMTNDYAPATGSINLSVNVTSAEATNTSDKHTTNNNNNRQWAIGLFSLTTVLLFADQNLMAPNLTAIAEEFGFDDEERDTKLGGHIALAFWILGAPAALVVGVLADSLNRSVLFAWTVGIGEGACFLTFWTTTYWELYLCRAITGFSIGGALPLIYSILGDMFTADERHKVNAYVGIGTGAGCSLGQGIAGLVGPTFGWRLPFLVVSIPALVCAAVVFFTVKDPERGAMEEVVLERKRRMHYDINDADDNSSNDNSNGNSIDNIPQKEIEMQQLKPNEETDNRPLSRIMAPAGVRRRSRSLERTASEADEYPCEKGPLRIMKNTPLKNFYESHIHPTIMSLSVLLKTPTVVLALMQGAPGCLPWGIVNTYLNDFLAEDRGMSVEFATFTVLWFGAGNFLGILLGGAGGQYLYRIDRRYPALLAGSMAIFGCVPFWILLNGVNNNSPFVYIAAISLVAGLASGITGPIIKATLQNVTLPTMRGQAFALFNTFDDFGRGLGPVFVAYMITSLGGRTPAFNLGTLGWILCGIFNLAVFFTVDGDERRGQATISATLSQDEPSNVLC